MLVDTVITGLPQTLEERDAAGALVAHHSYGRRRLSTTNGTTSSFYQHDALGSTRLLTDGAGAVTDTYGYEAYGNLATATGSTNNPYLFTGERFEPSLGLYDLRARNYAPSGGRFLGRDPASARLGDPRSAHPFLYAHADPVNVTDPTGRYSLMEIATVLGMDGNLRAADCGVKLIQACRTVGLAKGFGQAAVLAATAIVAGLTYELAETIATRDPFFFGVPSGGLVTGRITALPKPTTNGLEKSEHRIFVKPALVGLWNPLGGSLAGGAPEERGQALQR